MFKLLIIIFIKKSNYNYYIYYKKMGNKITIKDYINKITQKNSYSVTQDEYIENELKRILPAYQSLLYANDYNGQMLFIRKNNFRLCLQLSDEKYLEKIFEIFGEKDEKNEDIITIESIKYLYYSFTTDDINIKLILIAFLNFGNKEILEENDIGKNISIFDYPNNELRFVFNNYFRDLSVFVNPMSGKHKHSKIEARYINRDDFIRYLFNFEKDKNKKIEAVKDFHFLKKYIGTSEYKLTFINNKIMLDFYFRL